MIPVRFYAALTLLLAGFWVCAPASATSWFGGSTGAKIVGGAYIPAPSQGQSYASHQPMTVINPGGWGTLPEQSFLTSADMDALAVHLKMQQEQFKAQKDALDLDRAQLAERRALMAVLVKQNVANGITPLGVAPEAANNANQKQQIKMNIPKAPVQEWDAINRAQQASPKPQ